MKELPISIRYDLYIKSLNFITTVKGNFNLMDVGACIMVGAIYAMGFDCALSNFKQLMFHRFPEMELFGFDIMKAPKEEAIIALQLCICMCEDEIAESESNEPA